MKRHAVFDTPPGKLPRPVREPGSFSNSVAAVAAVALVGAWSWHAYQAPPWIYCIALIVGPYVIAALFSGASSTTEKSEFDSPIDTTGEPEFDDPANISPADRVRRVQRDSNKRPGQEPK